MTTLKLKAWHKEKKTMAVVYEINFENESVVLDIEQNGGYWWYASRFNLSEVVLLQYIGLVDCNSKEIYSGYIVKVAPTVLNGLTRDLVGVVELKCGNYVLRDSRGDWWECLDSVDNLEIIGNIYQHPELLSEPKEKQEPLYTAVAKIGNETINIGEVETSSVKDSNGRIKSNESFTVKFKTGGTLSYTAQKDNIQPKLYTKKPVQIEALQYVNYKDVIKFTNGTAHSPTESTCIIPTLEGEHIANKGDYIIKGVKGEFYPCKPDIFEMTYDKVE